MPEFNLVNAVSSSYRQVDLTFSNPVTVDAAATSIGTYAIDKGLLVIAVNVIAADTIRLFTSNQTTGVTYTIVIGSALQDDTFQTLTLNSGMFAGQSPTPPYVVDDLDARSECSGRAVNLSWTNPDGVNSVRILRRLRAWPFDLAEDAYDTVYDGPPIENFQDTGVVAPISYLKYDVSAGATSITVSGFVVYPTFDDVRLDGPAVSEVTNVNVGVYLGGPDESVYPLNTPLAHDFPAGSRVGRSTPLLPQTYYYYLVLVDSVSNVGQFDVTDDSRTFALSIDVYDGKGWFRDETSKHDLELDAQAVPLIPGSGSGFLDKWFAVMGCWLNLMRGHFNALSLVGNPDEAPFNMMTALNQSLGIDPEGAAYDFDAERRSLGSLVFIYQRKGTCPGIVETVRMFCKWDAACVELGQNGCNGGPSALETWDGDSSVDYGQGIDIVQTVISPTGVATFTDPSKGAWADGLWNDGRLRGWIGDIACIDENVGSVITTKAPTKVTELTSDHVAGTTVFNVASTALLQPGMTFQVTSSEEDPPGSGQYPAEVFDVDTITTGAPGTINSVARSQSGFAYPAGSMISIAKSIVRAEWIGSDNAMASGSHITDSSARWVENQWKGYRVIDGNNASHNVVSNDSTTIETDGLPVTPYAIARTYQFGVDFDHRVPELRYQVENGVHAELFEPTFDVEESGTIYDPFSYLWQGPGAATLLGSWGPQDLGVYILGNVPKGSGLASTAVTFTFDLDPTQPPPANDAWVGYFLNPNQNQGQLFEILSNTTTQLTVAGDVSSLLVPGQAYYVLTARDAVKFKRISARLKREFSHTDVKVHVLFV